MSYSATGRFIIRIALMLALSAGMLIPASAQDAVWIDVRSPREYRQGHIEGAINIPHGEIGHKVLQLVPNTFVEVHLYDANLGTFAGIALELMMEMGYQAVINEGGYDQVLARQADQSAAEQ